MTASILIVGGAGYIGSHMEKTLSDAGCRATVFDNLLRGYRATVLIGKFVHRDLLSRDNLKKPEKI